MRNIDVIKSLLKYDFNKLNIDISAKKYKNEFVRVNKVIYSNKLEESLSELINKSALTFATALIRGKEKAEYIIIANDKNNKIEVLFRGKENEKIEDSLKIAYPGIEMDNASIDEGLIKKLKYKAVITSIPMLDEKEVLQFDTFIRSIISKNIALKIDIDSVNKDQVCDIYDRLLHEKSSLSEKININISESKMESEGTADRQGVSENKSNSGSAIVLSTQESEGKSQDKTYSTNKSITSSESYEKIDFYCKEIDEILEKNLERVRKMMKTGAVNVVVTVFADTEENLEKAIVGFECVMLNKCFEGINVCPIKYDFTITDIINIKSNSDKYSLINGSFSKVTNLYTQEELGSLLSPTFNEINGLSIVKRPQFSQQCKMDEEMYLGNIMNYSNETNQKIYLNSNDINKHVLIAGITGSGKTNTIFSILKNLDVPFLVIEPAKTEYRVLKSVVKDLRIYTLGKEQISPFRLNPFKFKINTVSLQEHIDNIKSIFISAFSMYASMPNILEQCLVNIYIKKGWSLIDSSNIFCKDNIKDEFYPNIEDLYFEVERYINSLGYAEEQNQNIKAALMTRLKSMMTGSKGLMLNTSESVEIDDLLKYPTILELDGIADNEEKSLIMGFIMINMYEHIKSRDSGYCNELNHLIIIEEAHRLFSNVTSSQNQELVNTIGKSVETLSNILCEIRAYGEGMVIIDQVPSKLAPDVLKNTNTKIIHRLVSKDDYEYISKSIQIRDEDIDFISRLKVGETLVYNEKLEDTVHVKIKFNKDNYKYLSNLEVMKISSEYNEQIWKKNNIHPLSEWLMTYEETKDKIVEASKGFINKSFKDINNLSQHYKEITEVYLKIAYDLGFDIKDNYQQFVDDLIMQSCKYITKESKLSNNTYRRIYLKNFLLRSLEISKLDREKNLKIYKALEVSIKENRIIL